MKLTSIDFGQVARISSFFLPKGPLFLPDAVASMQERYRFVEVPQSLSDVNAENGVEFRHGQFKGQVIDKFRIFRDGLLADGKINTEIIDEFIDDVILWLNDEFELEKLDMIPEHKIYDSHVVVQMDISLDNEIKKLQSMTKLISNKVRSYVPDIENPPYILSGFVLRSDNAQQMSFQTSTFSLERRAGQPFMRNLYYSTAPLLTNDHIEILEALERIF